MQMQQYQSLVGRTLVTRDDPTETVKLTLIGLTGELGEIAEPVKKHLYGGHPLDRVHLSEEVGDLVWYLANLCTALGLDLEQAMAANLTKLTRRYPEGYSPERSQQREEATSEKEGSGQGAPDSSSTGMQSYCVVVIPTNGAPLASGRLEARSSREAAEAIWQHQLIQQITPDQIASIFVANLDDGTDHVTYTPAGTPPGLHDAHTEARCVEADGRADTIQQEAREG